MVAESSSLRRALTWRVYLAFLFATFLIQPAFIYYYLISGQTLPIAGWIPILLWTELANLLRAKLYKQEIFLLLSFQSISLAYALFFPSFMRNTYFAYSEPAVYFGLVKEIPSWFVPKGSDLAEVLTGSLFFIHGAWLIPVGVQLLILALGMLTELIIGYLSYQVFVVSEKLEFPAARAAVMTVSTLVARPPNMIRVIFLSALAGSIVHLVAKFLPFMLGPFMAGGLMIYYYAMPYFDLTPYLDNILPGASFIIPLDPAFYVPGFLLPLNTALYQFIGAFSLFFVGSHIITRLRLWPQESLWATGWGYWTLQYRSYLYFYVSLIIGMILAIVMVGISLNPRPLISGINALRRATQSSRGVLSPKYLLLIYLASSAGLTLVIWSLTGFSFPIWILFPFVVFGTFFTNYIATASSGVTYGQINIPFMRELIIYYSGYPNRDIWFVPLPLSISSTLSAVGASAGGTPMGGSAFAQGFLQADLLETRHGEYLRAFLVLLALSLFSSFLFASLFWFVAPMPSSAYPATILQWPIEALNWARFQVWVWSGYLFNLNWMLTGVAVGSAMTVASQFLKVPYLPTIFISGVLWGIPFAFAQLLASLIGNRFIANSFGRENWDRYKAIIVMGYLLGDGLMETIRVVVVLVIKSGWLLPF